MKFAFPSFLVPVVASLTLLALPLQMAAQEIQGQSDPNHPRYKLIDLGTFGGPNSFVNGPGTQDLSVTGTYAGEADTDIPDPYAPTCQSPDCLVQYAQVWRDGRILKLDGLPGVNISSGATWVSANGQFISGVSDNGVHDPLTGAETETRAVIWTRDGRVHDLGTLPGGTVSFGFAVNSSGQVIAGSNNTVNDPYSVFGWTTQTRTFLWQNGYKQDIGTLGGPDTESLTINELGQITGQSYTSSTANSDNGPGCPPNVPTQDPFFWENGKMTDIGSLGGTCGTPGRLNNRGQVVGTSNLADQTPHPFYWDRRGLVDMGTLGGPTGSALDISDSGLAVGTADLADGTHHAFVWQDGVMTDVGVVPGDSCTNGRASNSRGQAIGTSTDCMNNVKHMFLWQNGSIHDLTALILPGSDLQVFEAWDMNDKGEIAAIGQLPNGDTHAVLLVPANADEIAAATTLNPSTRAAASPHSLGRSVEYSPLNAHFKPNALRRLRRLISPDTEPAKVPVNEETY